MAAGSAQLCLCWTAHAVSCTLTSAGNMTWQGHQVSKHCQRVHVRGPEMRALPQAPGPGHSQSARPSLTLHHTCRAIAACWLDCMQVCDTHPAINQSAQLHLWPHLNSAASCTLSSATASIMHAPAAKEGTSYMSAMAVAIHQVLECQIVLDLAVGFAFEVLQLMQIKAVRTDGKHCFLSH